ncbi:putative type-I PKS [Streptomyces sp. W007]|nr:putative type-I PKS [Streptomyces sp. W007]
MIGTALRFPGADTPGAYWHDIRTGTGRVRRFTRAEFAAAGVPAAEYERPGFGGASALLGDVDGFDAGFFGMSGREAELTDPQQRLFLECCFHALEDGGYAGGEDRYAGGDGDSVRIGVYGSSGYRLYSLHSYLAENLAAEAGSGDWMTAKQVQVGNYPDFTATRAAFRLGLTGPALTVSTACSSALVSVHLACQALRAGDADLMLVGSAALHLPEVTGQVPVKGSTLSPTGTVRAFDADADGTVGGNGAAAVLLKPLARALADGDTVHAVILGSAVTNDGSDKATNDGTGRGGFAAPGVAGQRDAVLGALCAADVDAASIGYVEAHGTGTLKGDPIEFAALTEAFRAHTGRTGFCALGSTKPAIGHLDSAAGLAGLIKAVEVLRHGVVPPLVNFSRPNPALAVEDSPFLLPVRESPWPLAGVRRAGVHSIGMGGTNAHVILEQAPETSRTASASDDVPVPALLPLSAADEDALRAYADLLRDHLAGGACSAPPRRSADHHRTRAAAPAAPAGRHGRRPGGRSRRLPVRGPGGRGVHDRGRRRRTGEAAGVPLQRPGRRASGHGRGTRRALPGGGRGAGSLRPGVRGGDRAGRLPGADRRRTGARTVGHRLRAARPVRPPDRPGPTVGAARDHPVPGRRAQRRRVRGAVRGRGAGDRGRDAAGVRARAADAGAGGPGRDGLRVRPPGPGAGAAGRRRRS